MHRARVALKKARFGKDRGKASGPDLFEYTGHETRVGMVNRVDMVNRIRVREVTSGHRPHT